MYGNETTIGGIHYAILFVDQTSRYKIIIGMENLQKQSVRQAIKKFIRKIGFYPDTLVADRDFKLIGKHVTDLLEPHTSVSRAPSGRQSQNELIEANWKYVCNIARNFMVRHLLPAKIWYFCHSLLYLSFRLFAHKNRRWIHHQSVSHHLWCQA